jgi:hypothetical protein
MLISWFKKTKKQKHQPYVVLVFYPYGHDKYGTFDDCVLKCNKCGKYLKKGIIKTYEVFVIDALNNEDYGYCETK